MNDIAIRVEGLRKSYPLRKSAGCAGYRTLRDEVEQLPRRLWETVCPSQPKEEFRALSDVSFEVKRGEVLGVIGRNGAGKSTLLKILSRIVEPTQGGVDLYGRVGSLLEVGTGFHPELTGRENIFLSGAMMGMRRHEVRTRFDEIVQFAGVENFLETPCKHYSSGMYMRLGFAVAAHLDTEILLVDEVLAVGDFEFQRRCMGKMSDVAHDGRTILFVSHNVSAIRQMCTRALWLTGGRVHAWGEAGDVVSDYLRAGEDTTVRNRTVTPEAMVHFAEVRLVDASGAVAGAFCVGDDLGIEFRVQVSPALVGRPLKLAVALRSADGVALANMVDTDSDFSLDSSATEQWLRVTLVDQRFYPGSYHISLWAGSSDSQITHAVWEDAARINVTGGGGRTARVLPRSAGLLFLTPRWDHLA